MHHLAGLDIPRGRVTIGVEGPPSVLQGAFSMKTIAIIPCPPDWYLVGRHDQPSPIACWVLIENDKGQREIVPARPWNDGSLTWSQSQHEGGVPQYLPEGP